MLVPPAKRGPPSPGAAFLTHLGDIGRPGKRLLYFRCIYSPPVLLRWGRRLAIVRPARRRWSGRRGI